MKQEARVGHPPIQIILSRTEEDKKMPTRRRMAILFWAVVAIAIVAVLTLARRTVSVPDFAVAVKLSKAAEARLRSLNESVAVMAFFDGDGKGEGGKSTAPFRAVFLGNEQEIMTPGSIAEFSGKRIPLKAWNRLSDKNYYVTVNVGSARRAAKENILDCETHEYRIEEIKGRIVQVHCSLMGEPGSEENRRFLEH